MTCQLELGSLAMGSQGRSEPPHWLTAREERAWRGYRRMSLLLNARVARDLAVESGLSEPDYDVLSALTESPDARCRISELADHMLWSRSRLSHHIARMETRGLVTREAHPQDGRGAVVVLAPGGRHAIEAAAPGHVASVRAHLFDRLTPAEVDALAEITGKVVGPLRDDPQRPV